VVKKKGAEMSISQTLAVISYIHPYGPKQGTRPLACSPPFCYTLFRCLLQHHSPLSSPQTSLSTQTHSSHRNEALPMNNSYELLQQSPELLQQSPCSLSRQILPPLQQNSSATAPQAVSLPVAPRCITTYSRCASRGMSHTWMLLCAYIGVILCIEMRCS